MHDIQFVGKCALTKVYTIIISRTMELEKLVITEITFKGHSNNSAD